MSDIELSASVDFRAAEKQVEVFSKKMSDILAAANKRGGSNAALGNAAATATAEAKKTETAYTAWMKQEDARRKATQTTSDRAREQEQRAADNRRIASRRSVMRHLLIELDETQKAERAARSLSEREQKQADARRIAGRRAVMRELFDAQDREAKAGKDKIAANERLARSERTLAEAANRDIIAQDRLRANANAENERRARQTEKDRVSAINRVASAQRTVAEAENAQISAQERARSAANAENIRRDQAAAKSRETGAARALSSQRTVAEAENKQITASSTIRARAEDANKKFDQNAYDRMRSHAEQENREHSNRMARTRRAADEDNKLFDRARDQRSAAEAENQKHDQIANNRMRSRAEQDNREHNNRMARVRSQADAENRAFDSAQRMRIRADADNRKFDATSSGTNASSTRANVRAIGGAENTALGVTNRIGRQLGDDPALQARLIGQLDKALIAYTNTLRTHGASSTEAARASISWNRELQNVRSSVAENGGLLRALSGHTDTLRGSITNLGGGFSSLSRLMLNTQVVLSGLTAAFGLREIVQSIMNFERFSNTLRTVSGDAQTTSENMRFLFATADRVGFSVADVGNSFARLSVAMQGAGFTNSEVQQGFTALTEASRNFGLASAETTGVIRAFEQSMSKGQFMAEEVRNQLGDRLPIAMAALQAAVQRVDGRVVDLNKRFEEGSIDVQRYGVAFMEEIRRMSGGSDALALTSTSMSAAFGRLSTEFLRFTQELEKGGFGQAVTSAANQLQEFMERARESGALEVLGQVALAVANNFTTLAGALTPVVGIYAGSRLIQGIVAIGSMLAQLSPIARGAAVAAAAITVLAAAYTSTADAANAASRTIAQSVQNASRATEIARTAVVEASVGMTSGLQGVASSAESDFDKIVRSAMRMGQSVQEAMRTAMEATANLVRAQVSVTESALSDSQKALEAYLNRVTNVGRVQGNLDSRVAAATTSGYAIPTNYLEIAGQFNALIDSFKDGSRPINEIGAALRALQGDAVEAFTAATASSDGNTRAMSGDFAAMGTMIETLLRAFGRLDEVQLTALRGQVTDITTQLTTQRSHLAALNSGLDSGSLPQYGPTRPTVAEMSPREVNFANAQSSRQRTAEANLRREAREAGLMGPVNDGRRTALGTAPTLDTLLGEVRTRARGGDTGAAESLERYNKALRETGGAAAGARGAVAEFMRDLELSADASEATTGAEKAHADALKRLRDAATRTGASLATAAQERAVEDQVNRRLANQRDGAIRTMNRETAATNAVAAAYARSNAAGREAEITTQAQTRALETAKAGTPQYTQAVLELTEALRKKAEADANATASRSIDTMNDEIAIMRLEGTLISANTNLRTEELAVARALQAARGSSPEILAQVEATTRQTVQLRTQNEQLTNSWNDLSSIGTQAFDKIGTAITTAFANGTLKALNFKSIMKAVFSEVAQAALKMAVINPILNYAFGGTRGTAGGIFNAFTSAVGSGGSGAGISGSVAQVSGGTAGAFDAGSATGAMNSAGQTLALRQIGSYGNLGNAFTNQGPAITGYNFVDSALNANIIAPTYSSAVGAGANASGFVSGTAMAGEAGAFVGGGGQALVSPGLSVAGGIGGVAGIAGGAYGVYSGLKKGGVGGAVGVAGGAASMIGGASILGMLGPAMAALGPYALVAAAVLAIASALLPGAKPSGMGQESRVDLMTGATTKAGLGGKRYSEGNADAAKSAAQSIADLANEIGTQLGGAKLGGNAAVGVTNGTLYLDVVGRKASFGNDEAGSKALAEQAGVFVLQEFKKQGNVRGEYAGILNGSNSIAELSENLKWYEEVYKSFKTTGEAASAFSKQMGELTKPFDAAIEKAQALSLSTDDITAAREKETKKLQEQRDASLDNAMDTLSGREAATGLSGADPYGLTLAISARAAVRAAAEEIATFGQSLKDLGVGADEVAEAVARLTAVQAAELAQKNAEQERQRIYGAQTTTNDIVQRGIAVGIGWDIKAVLAERAKIDAANEIAELTQKLQGLGLSAADTAAWTEYLVKVQTAEAAAKAAEASTTTTTTGPTAAERETAAGNALSTITNLREYVSSLTTSDVAAGTAMDRYSAAQRQFDTTYSSAVGGDANSITALQGAAETYRTNARDIFGGGQGYADAIALISDRIGAVSGLGEEALTQSFIAENAAENTDRIVDALGDLKAENMALRADLNLMMQRPAA